MIISFESIRARFLDTCNSMPFDGLESRVSVIGYLEISSNRYGIACKLPMLRMCSSPALVFGSQFIQFSPHCLNVLPHKPFGGAFFPRLVP